MRMLKMVPVLMFAVLAFTACGKKEAPDLSGSNPITGNPSPSLPNTPPVTGDFTANCQSRGGQVYNSVCAIPVSYFPSSGWTWSTNYPGTVAAGQGVVVAGSGNASVSVGGQGVSLNSHKGFSSSGTLKISTSGSHQLQVWVVRCENASFQAVSCAGF